MVRVQRANVVLQVPEEQIKEYLAKGFDVLGNDGQVVQASVPNDVNLLKQKYVEFSNRIKALEDEVASLKAKKTSTKSEVTTEEKPKRKTTRAKKED